jgi:hypothetical protein
MTRSSFQENATEAARKAYIERETAAFGDLNVLFNDTPTLLAQIAPLLGGARTFDTRVGRRVRNRLHPIFDAAHAQYRQASDLWSQSEGIR